VLWTSIGLEPAVIRSAGQQPLLATYRLRLPLVADGRIAFVQLRADPEEARVTCISRTAESFPGRIRFSAGQWNFIWDQGGPHTVRPPPVRLSGNRFLHGDPVCLRQQGGPLLIYRVCPPALAGHASRAN
jgi:hypothetical protein